MAVTILKTDKSGTGWSVVVEVSEGGSKTTHTVSVSEDAHKRYGGGSEVGDLVRRSFDFLLARESKESILKSFDLPVIACYFPEYDREFSK